MRKENENAAESAAKNTGKRGLGRGQAKKENAAKEGAKKENAGKNGAKKETADKEGGRKNGAKKEGSRRRGAKKEETVNESAAAETVSRKESGAKKETAKKEGAKKEGSRRGGSRRTKTIKTEPEAFLEVLESAAATAATVLTKGKGRKKQADNSKKVKIIPLGGLEQIGMNITAFEYDDSIIVVDCGLAFPSDDMLGIDLVIPDVTYLKNNIDKVKGFVITHGHEDHIGALPYVLKEINVPVYGTKLTIALIEHKLEEHNMMKSTKRKVVKHGQTVNLGCFRVEFIKTNHSIADASALAIFSPAGVILHTGDFKIDYTPVFGDTADLQRFAELGKKGVLALMCDSTNAIRQGFTMSEKTVGRRFDAIFAEHRNNRIIVATFASNVDRVQQVVNSAYKYGRKVVVEGRSMVNVIGIASELGYIKIPEGTLIDIDQLKNYKDEDTVLITTGSQGESMAALSRMASSMHRKVSIKPSDVIVMSSSPIPGNEKSVARVINELSQKGAEVIFEDTHVSGHACQEEIKLIYSLVHPKFALPVHGEYRHLTAQAGLAEKMGIPKENIVIMSSGDVVEIGENSCQIVDHVQNGGILVDGLGVGDVGNIVLRDRQNLAQNGIIIVVLSLEKYTNQLLAGPDIVSRGFVYVRESEDLMDEAQIVVDAAVQDCLRRHVSDWGKIKTIIKDSLSDFLWKKMKRSPMILPIIMEVEP